MTFSQMNFNILGGAKKTLFLASIKFIYLNQELRHYNKRLGKGKEKDIFLPWTLKKLLVL